SRQTSPPTRTPSATSTPVPAPAASPSTAPATADRASPRLRRTSLYRIVCSYREGENMAGMVEEILAQIPADDLANRLGTDPETAMDAARKALPALLGGLDQEVRTGKGEALGLAALQDHDEGLLDGPNPLAAVDIGDGEKIL